MALDAIEESRMHDLVFAIPAFAGAARLSVHRSVLASSAASEPAGPLPLSPAELRVLPYLQTHLTTDRIAEQLFLSGHTVKTEIKAIYRKLGVSSRNDAVQRATAMGLLGT